MGFSLPSGVCVGCKDPTVGVGPQCEFTNEKTCSGFGVAQYDGTCVGCDAPAAGVGPNCEFTNEKTCKGLGIAQYDGTCIGCNDSAIGVGPQCQYTDDLCFAGKVDRNGVCTSANSIRTSYLVGDDFIECARDSDGRVYLYVPGRKSSCLGVAEALQKHAGGSRIQCEDATCFKTALGLF